MSNKRINLIMAQAAADKAVEWCLNGAANEQIAASQEMLRQLIVKSIMGLKRWPNTVVVMNSEQAGFTVTTQVRAPADPIARTKDNYVEFPNMRPRKASLEISKTPNMISLEGVGFIHPAKDKPGYRFNPWMN